MWIVPVTGEPNPNSRMPAGHVQALAELERLLGFHISLAHTAIKAHFQSHFRAVGLTQKQIAILWLIDSCPDIIQSDLARMLRVKRAAMWAMVGRLCTRNLLERLDAEGVDARHVALKLTSAGSCVLGRAKQAILRHEAWVKQGFAPEEQRAVARLMTKLHGRID
jgi:DNA-binding MarR family transcriptional regulator